MLAITLDPELHFLQRCWEEESVIHVIAAGETHLLSSAGTLLIERLKTGPVPFDLLVDEFTSISEEGQREEIADLLRDIIREIRKIGLIQTVEIPS